MQLGRDNDADPNWIGRAAEMSTDDGPVWKANLRMIVEDMAPAFRDRSQKVEESLLQGTIPIHITVSALNISFSRVLIDLPVRNAEEQQDSRRRVVIPIHSGRRQTVNVRKDWTVGFDVTSIIGTCLP